MTIINFQNIHFTFGAVTIDPGTPAYNPRPLIPYLKSLGVPYFYEEQGLIVNKKLYSKLKWFFCLTLFYTLFL